MSLLELPVEQTATIDQITAGDDDALLRAMGLCEGQPVRVLRRAPFGGPLQIRVGEVSFAIGRALASTVLVKVSTPG
ncbi:MAG: ferrous iron transport protein A [Polyangiaceae bacterium]|jgi:ferrous iron transport protein A|nr:ferrous iron transport protein A [Polyangiaceae bacterium]